MSSFELGRKSLTQGAVRISESMKQRGNQCSQAELGVVLEMPQPATVMTLQDIRALRRLLAQAEQHIAYREEQLLCANNLCLDF